MQALVWVPCLAGPDEENNYYGCTIFRTAHLYPDMWFLRFWVVKPPPIVHARDPLPSLLCLYHRSIANPLGSEGSLLDTPM